MKRPSKDQPPLEYRDHQSETKALLGSADPQCHHEKSVTRAPLMAYWSYCFVVVWFVDQFRMEKTS